MTPSKTPSWFTLLARRIAYLAGARKVMFAA